MKAYELQKRYTVQELVDMAERIRQEPKNQLQGQFDLYTKNARKKLDEIAWAIFHHQKERRG